MTDSILWITLSGGQKASLLRFDDKKVSIKSTLSFPPGATVRGSIETLESPFELKVRNCRKEGAEFIVEGRTQNATRELVALLKKHGHQPPQS